MRALSFIWVVLAVAGCRFDGGGLPGGADPDANGGDDDVPIDADPGAPDAETPPPPPPDAMPAPVPGQLVAAPAQGTVAVDGVDTEYTSAGADAITFAIQDGELYEVLHASYAASSTVTVRAIHDAQAIYFFARVTDSVYAVDSVDVWDDDGIAIFLDVLGDAAGPYGVDDHALYIAGDGAWDDFGPVGTAATVTVGDAQTTGAFTLEVRVDKDSLSAAVGASMGFDLGLTDDDGWGDSSYDSSSLWFHSARAECATCCTSQTLNQPWCDTTMFGTLVLE